MNYLIYHCREAFSVWKSSSTKLNVVPDGLVQDVFYKLNLYPTKEQGKFLTVRWTVAKKMNLKFMYDAWWRLKMGDRRLKIDIERWIDWR